MSIFFFFLLFRKKFSMLLKNQIISVPLKINVRERIWFSNEPSNVHYPPRQIKSKSKLDKRRKSLGNFCLKFIFKFYSLGLLLFKNLPDRGFITLKYVSLWSSILSYLLQKYLHGFIKVNCLISK